MRWMIPRKTSSTKMINPRSSFLLGKMSLIKKVLRDVYSVDIEDNWDVLNEKDNLSLIHYKTERGEPENGELRGVVIDKDLGIVVASSFRYTPNETYDEEIPIISPEQKYYLGIEGTILRVFKNKGKIYISTHKKIDAVKSRWGSSPTFVELFRKNGSYDINTLFDADCDYGIYCYVFMVVDPSIMVSSKLPIGESYDRKGFVMYLGTCKTSDDLSKFNGAKVDTRERIIDTSDMFDYLTKKSENPIVRPKEITVEQAKEHLTTGLFSLTKNKNSLATMNGEFVIIASDDLTKFPDMVKLCSRAYLYKLDVRGGDPNVYHRYFTLKDERIAIPIVDENYILDEFPSEFSEYIIGNMRNKEYINILNSIPRDRVKTELRILERFSREIEFGVNAIIAKIQRKEEFPYFLKIAALKPGDRFRNIKDAFLGHSMSHVYSIIKLLRDELRENQK